MRSHELVALFGSAGLLLHEHRERKHAERLAAATLETLLNAVDANDPLTGAHARRVARYALILADAADLDERAMRAVERIALFHDIGKIHEALFDAVHDDDALTPQQRHAILTHPERGAEVLAPLAPFYPELPDGVRAHHEHWDGGGYPRRLAGNDIPLPARIVSIADTFDALTHQRRYRAGRAPAHAAQVIGNARGTQFDPELTDLFLCPPVFACILDALRRAHAPRRGRHREDRRAERDEEQHVDAPDVRFRWRSRGTA